LSAANSAWRDLLSAGNGARFLVVTGGVALHAVSIYVVATIMPTVVGDLGGLPFFAWTTTLYVSGALTGAAAVPLVLARGSPRLAYRLAFLLFLTGSLCCAAAPIMPALLVGRLAQGIGGGMLPALAYSTVRSMFPSSLHARAITLFGSVWGVAALIGPSIGGVFAAFGTWRGAFLADLVIGLIFLAMAERVLPAHIEGAPPRGRFPGIRLLLLAGAAMALSVGGLSGQTRDAAIGIVAAGLMVAAVLWLDGRAEVRLLPHGAFHPAVPLGAVSATIGFLILATAPVVFVPYLLQAGRGASPILAGYASALVAIAWTGASLVTAGASRSQVRQSIAVGAPLMALGIAVDAWALSGGPFWAVVAGQVLIGVGIGLPWAHLGALMMEVAPAESRATAGPFITTTQTLASVFGSAVAGMVANLAGLPLATTALAIGTSAAILFGVLMIFPIIGVFMSWQVLRLTR